MFTEGLPPRAPDTPMPREYHSTKPKQYMNFAAKLHEDYNALKQALKLADDAFEAHYQALINYVSFLHEYHQTGKLNGAPLTPLKAENPRITALKQGL